MSRSSIFYIIINYVELNLDLSSWEMCLVLYIALHRFSLSLWAARECGQAYPRQATVSPTVLPHRSLCTPIVRTGTFIFYFCQFDLLLLV